MRDLAEELLAFVDDVLDERSRKALEYVHTIRRGDERGPSARGVTGRPATCARSFAGWSTKPAPRTRRSRESRAVCSGARVPPAFIDRVNTAGRPHGITAEMVTLTGTKMGEPSGYRVIVDRISHEVGNTARSSITPSSRAPTSSTTRSGGPPTTSSSTTCSPGGSAWRCRRRSCCRRSRILEGIDLTAESLANLGYPIDWDGLLDATSGGPQSSSPSRAAAGSTSTRCRIRKSCSPRTT